MGFRISEEATWGVIGYGSWGTALVKIILAGGGKVNWLVRNSEVRDHLATHGTNPKYLRDVNFQSCPPNVSGDVNHVVGNSDIIVLAAPSAFLRNTLDGLVLPLADKFVISAIKGIVVPEHIPVSDYMRTAYGVPAGQIGILTGPCHAEEVALGRLSYLTMVCRDQENAHALATRLSSDYIRVGCSADVRGIEYASIIKNIYAIAVGIAVGLGYGDNFTAVLISNANTEMDRFLWEAFPFGRNVSASAYLGDLLVTSYSQFSRNRRFGMLVGGGCTVSEALARMEMVAEGYYAAQCITQIITEFGIELPITGMVHKILYEEASPAFEMQKLTEKLI